MQENYDAPSESILSQLVCVAFAAFANVCFSNVICQARCCFKNIHPPRDIKGRCVSLMGKGDDISNLQSTGPAELGRGGKGGLGVASLRPKPILVSVWESIYFSNFSCTFLNPNNFFHYEL